MQSLSFGIPDDGEQITANTVASGFHQPKGSIGGDRCIHGTATGFENIQRDLCRQWLCCRCRAIGGIDWAARPRRADRPAAGVNLGGWYAWAGGFDGLVCR